MRSTVSRVLWTRTANGGGAPDAPGGRHQDSIAYTLEQPILTAAIAGSVETRIAGLVQRLLTEHSIERDVAWEEDLRLVGLSSLDMVSLVLSVEEEFELMVPEGNIMPSNFRSIASISRLVQTLRQRD